MKKIALLFGLLTVGVGSAAQDNPYALSPAEREEGWRLLFNGASFDGWRGYRMAGIPGSGWAIQDGLLKTVPKARGRELITVDKFDDFDLRWEWKIAPGGNNGVKYFVTEERPAAPGHEYQMIDDATNPDGKVSPKRLTGSFYDVLAPAGNRPLKPAGQWNESRIVVRGNHVEHWLNGRNVLEYELGSDRVKAGLAESKFKNYPDFGVKIAGHIMLTYHNDECWYRNIKIRVLGAK
jgi:hypothetical protein